MKFVGSMVILISLSSAVAAQDYPRKHLDLSVITDELAAFQDEDLNYDDLYENYAQLFAHPLDLNKANADQLRMLNLLSENQINSLLEYRDQNGSLVSVYELQAVPLFDLPTINKIIGFVTVDDPRSTLDKSFFQRVRNNESTYLVSRYERTLFEKKGFKLLENPDDEFKGSEDKMYFRFRSNIPNDYSVGFTAEKDAGERLAWRPSSDHYGTDYLSYHLQLSNKKNLKNLIIGDYQCSFGQGLVIGNAFGLGKGGETINTVRKSNIGFLPYTSVNEAAYLRGAAATYQLYGNWLLSTYYSSAKRDAAVDTTESPTFSSLIASGLHRNEKELRKRKTIGETNIGAVLNFKTRKLDAGIILQAVRFDASILKNQTPYNQFSFSGTENINTSFFINYNVRNVTFFSEIAKSYNGGNGIVAGALSSLTTKFELAMLARFYDRDFYAFYSNAFAESTLPQNEKGIYWGWKYKINRRYSIAGYVDLFQFPWLKFRTYKPSNGYELLLRFNYQPSKKILLFAQYRQENKARNASDESPLYVVSNGLKQNVWFNCDYEVFRGIRMKTRAQFSTYDYNRTRTDGMVILQDLNFTIGKFQFIFRHAIFDTDNYDNRQYVYENDVWLAYSLPVYDGNGVRNFALLEYKVNRKVSLWLRYSQTKYQNKEEIGSGVDMIEGNKTSDIKIQTRIRL